MTLSYQNDPALKARFCGHIERHRVEDRVQQGLTAATTATATATAAAARKTHWKLISDKLCQLLAEA